MKICQIDKTQRIIFLVLLLIIVIIASLSYNASNSFVVDRDGITQKCNNISCSSCSDNNSSDECIRCMRKQGCNWLNINNNGMLTTIIIISVLLMLLNIYCLIPKKNVM